MTDVVHLDDLEAEPHATVVEERPRTVRLALAAGESVPEHRHPGEDVLLYVVSGAVELAVGGTSHALEAGHVARFDGDEPVAPRAVEDAVALVVFAPREE